MGESDVHYADRLDKVGRKTAIQQLFETAAHQLVGDCAGVDVGGEMRKNAIEPVECLSVWRLLRRSAL